MLYEIMKHIRNFFVYERKENEYTITNGILNMSIDNGVYFLIEGSLKNDGVYQKTNELQLKDESFNGCVSILAVPHDFVELCTEISTFCDKNVENGLVSESFGGYSYTKAQKNGVAVSWQDAFRARLNTWRKL